MEVPPCEPCVVVSDERDIPPPLGAVTQQDTKIAASETNSATATVPEFYGAQPNNTTVASMTSEGTDETPKHPSSHGGAVLPSPHHSGAVDPPHSVIDAVCSRSIPISCVFFAVSVVVCLLVIFVIFLSCTALIQIQMFDFEQEFADRAIDRVRNIVSRHYDNIRSIALFVNTAVNAVDLIAGAYPDPTRFALLFGAYAVQQGANIRVSGAVPGVTDGLSFAIEASSIVDSADFPPLDGFAAAHVINASQPWMQIGYVSTITGRARNPQSPFIQFAQTFNFSARSYGPQFARGLGWSRPYASIYSNTSFLALGGPYFAPDSLSPRLGAFAVIDYTKDLVSRLGNLRLSANGKAMLFDSNTGTFLCGNIMDSPLTSTGAVRTVSDVHDPVVRDLLRVGWQQFVDCAGVCRFIFTDGVLSVEDSPGRRGVALFEDLILVRAASTHDTLGLDLTVVVTTPASDLSGALRDSLLRGLGLSVGVMTGLLILIAVLVHRLLMPLRAASRVVRSLRRLVHKGRVLESNVAGSESSDEASLTSCMSCGCRAGDRDVRCQVAAIAVREVDIIRTAVAKLSMELSVIRSFVPDHAWEMLQTGRGNEAELPRSASGLLPSSATIATASNNKAGLSNPLRSDECTTTTTATTASMTGSTTAAAVFGNCDLMAGEVSKPLSALLTNVTYVMVRRRHCTAMSDGSISKEQPSVLVDRHAATLTHLQSMVGQFGGTVHHFFGDDFGIHFNALKRNTKHVACALRLMMQLIGPKADLENRIGPHEELIVSAATSPSCCWVGGAGSGGTLQISGLCVPHAAALVHTASRDNLRGVCSWKTTQMAQYIVKDVYMRHVDVTLLPHEDQITIVSTPVPKEDIGNIRITSRYTGQPVVSPQAVRKAVHMSNEAYEAVVSGDRERAMTLLVDSPWTAQENRLAALAFMAASIETDAPDPSFECRDGASI